MFYEICLDYVAKALFSYMTDSVSLLTLLSCDSYLLWDAVFLMRRKIKIGFHLVVDFLNKINQEHFKERHFLHGSISLFALIFCVF